MGSVACKQTDGFVGANLSGAVGLEDATKQTEVLTPDAMAEIQNRLRELKNIEEDIALKDANITNFQKEIEDLKATIEQNNSVLGQGIAPDQILENLRQENESAQSLLETTTQTYNEYIQDRLAKDQEMMKMFTDMVSELSKYETSEKTEEFKAAIAAKLKIYEADRDSLAENIITQEQSIEELNIRLSELELIDTPEAIAEKASLSEQLVAQQELLNEMNLRLASLSNIVEINTCAIASEASANCPENLVVTVVNNGNSNDNDNDRKEVIALSAAKQAEMFSLVEDIKVLQEEKKVLESNVSELKGQIAEVDAKIQMANNDFNGVNRLLVKGLIEQLNIEKTDYLEKESAVLKSINDLNNKISLKTRQIVSH